MCVRQSLNFSSKAARWAQCMVATLAFLVSAVASAQATYGHTITSSSSVQFWVNGAPWADVHYTINGGGQQNFRMAVSGTNNTYNLTGVPSGATINYFFTVGTSPTSAFDSEWTSFTMSGAPPPPPTGNYTLVWEDTFSGSGQPNSANWNYHVGNGYNQGSFIGWGNGEWEWYRPENAYQQNGNLVIRADYLDTPFIVAGREWYQKSARITTKGKQSWKYGRIEARIAMPNAIGTWPAFWMMGTACDDGYTSDYAAPMSYYDVMATNWSSCGEIDIMEHRNTETVTFQNLFWDSRTGVFPWGNGMNNEQPNNIHVGDVTQFHLYTIEWEPTQIRWYIDRTTNPSPVHTVDITASNKEEFQKPFYIILNLALSGQFTGYAHPDKAQFPLYMYVDYVRVWQKQ